MLRTKILLLIACLFCYLAISSAQAVAEELWYTVQAGSYTKQSDAESFYNILSKKLHPHTTSDLRIEYVSSYYTVRAGKFKSSKDIITLLEEIQSVASKPLLIYAYVRPARIVWPPKVTHSSNDVSKSRPSSLPVKTTRQKSTHPQDTLFYIIQAGSYLKENAANQFYKNLAKKLPPKMRPSLRIEKIGSFFTVRFGKELTKTGAGSLLLAAKKLTNDPVVIHAYIRTSRITKYFSPGQQITNKANSPIDSLKNTSQPKKPASTTKSVHKPIQATTNQVSQKKSLLKRSSQTPQTPEIRPQEKKKASIVIPPKKKSPSLSPAEYEKKLLAKYLATSHQTQDSAMAHKKAASFPTSTDCTTSSCHTVLQKIPLEHFPAKQDKCLACHKQLIEQHPSEGGDSFKLVTTGAALCQQCHLTIIQGKIMHPPAQEGKCLTCHAPHGSASPFLLTVPKDKEQELCMKCHNSNMNEQRYQHGPVGLGKCTLCHNPHAADYPALLRDEPKTLCFNCHTELQKGLQDSSHIHTPVQDNDCQSCHAVHGSSFPNLLTADPHDFCFTCHPDIQKKFDKSRTKHAGLYLEKQCNTCHLAHYSENAYLLVKKEKELCLTCHGNNSPLKSFTPKNIEKEISNKEYIHTPVSEGHCSACHDPHGSQFDSLLVDAYPTTFYAPYDPDRYNLCFTCHDQELLTAKETEDETKFRNGSRNLHFVHVGIERKGRTCNACHNAHASDGPKLINRTGAKFGEWTMSIDFNLTNTGGSCMPGCHRKMNYDRDNTVNNAPPDTTSEKYYIDYKSQSRGNRALPF